jgi:hypothetical protein
MTPGPASLRDLTLAEIPGTVWGLLLGGVSSARDPFHTPCLATFGPQGPEQRTVVLRHVDPGQRILACHTDARSPKVREALDQSRCSWHFYDAGRKLQLRLIGDLKVHTDSAFADERWADSRAGSRACYNTGLAPGTPVPQPPGAPPPIDGSGEERMARSRFAVLACEVLRFDWLRLDGAGHRRARFRWKSATWAGEWVSP